MLHNRLFHVLIAAALVLVVALTVQEAFATTVVISQPNAVLECAALPSHFSIHTVFKNEAGMSVSYSEDGPTGVDGGLLELMSAYRNCQ